MKRLIILGAGGCGREVLEWAKDINEKNHRWDEFGFLDFDENILDNIECSAQIIGNDDNYSVTADDEFVCAVGQGAPRKKIIEKMEAKGAVFVNIIHPTAVVADSAKLGNAVILYPYSIVSANASVGKGCIVNMHSTVAHDVVMGDYCTISAHCDITGACTLGANVFFGTSVNLVPGVKIGDGAFICAGSTVMTRVRPGVKMLGNPARKVEL